MRPLDTRFDRGFHLLLQRAQSRAHARNEVLQGAVPAVADNVVQFNLSLAEQAPARRKAAGGANGRR
ncbi:hypothetical protein [Stenotrophomonas sp. M37]|uniref:hypothetical protein n=1 Tax=Stenotrophomonas sp. M37 TaxID=2662206 RepID=UPI001C12CEC3|nr:hypothetical protein [Stenotrophomonas sp. M37]